MGEIKFGFGQDRTNRFSDWTGEFWIDVDLKPNLVSFRDECINVAKMHTARINKKICVLMSGGMDCEVLLRSFLTAGADVIALTIDTGFNSYDVGHAKRICNELKVEHHIKHVNIFDYLGSSAFLATYDKIKFNSYWVYMSFIGYEYILEHLNATPVGGHGDVFFSFSPDQKTCFMEVLRGSVIGHYWAHVYGEDKIIPAFFFEENIINSYVFQEEIARANSTFNWPRSNWGETYWYVKHLKQTAFLKEWPELMPRFKVDGNESIFVELHKIFNKLPKVITSNSAMQRIPYAP